MECAMPNYQRQTAIQAVVDITVWGAAALVLAMLIAIVADVLWSGLSQIDWTFLTASPRKGGKAGGIAPFLVSTFAVTGIALAVAIPMGTGIALLVTEYLPRESLVGRGMRVSLVVLAAVPSIIFGLIGNVLFCEWMGLGFSLLAGGLTLAAMVMPIIACVVEQSLRSIPETIRAGAHALGLPPFRVVLRVILPLALPGITGGVALGFGRATAESAALIFTSGYVDRMPGSWFDSGRTLAVHILDLSMNVPGGDSRAHATAAVLLFSMLIVVVSLALVHSVARRKYGMVS
jgi:phosphate transport system permease protein